MGSELYCCMRWEVSCSKSLELHNYWRWEIMLLCEIGVLWLSEVGVVRLWDNCVKWE